jgi:hypothetical protein
MKAGSSRVTEKRKNGQERAARVERSRFIAPSGTAIAQVARIQSRRAWGWWKHRPHLHFSIQVPIATPRHATGRQESGTSQDRNRAQGPGVR